MISLKCKQPQACGISSAATRDSLERTRLELKDCNLVAGVRYDIHLYVEAGVNVTAQTINGVGGCEPLYLSVTKY